MNKENLISILAEVIPDPLFLVVAAGFLGVIMAFFVPVSVEMISKVSAKYNSDVIVRLYKNSFINRIFNELLLFAIAAMIAARFFNSPQFIKSVGGKIIMWSLLALALIITGLIGYLIRRINRFISDDSMPLKILCKEVQTALAIETKSATFSQKILPAQTFGKRKETASSSGNKPASRHDFIQAIEGIGDILIYQAGRHNDTLVLEGLERLGQSIQNLYEIRAMDKDKFNQLVYDEEFLQFSEQHKEDNQALHNFCFTNPDKFLDGLATPLNQMRRIYKAALEVQSSEIARLTLQKMNATLHYLTAQEDNFLAVNLLLKKFIECLQLSLRHNDESSELGIHWYSDILDKEPHAGENSFRLEYLDIYNRHFMGFISHIITEEHSNAFFSLVRHLIKIYASPNYQRGKVWGYHYLLKASNLNEYRRMNENLGIQRQVRHLAMTEAHLDTIEQLQHWLGLFDGLSQLIEPHLTINKKREAQRLDEIIKSNAIKHFKRRRLLRAAYAIGAHCLLQEKYSYIRYLWEHSGETHIVPQTIQQVIDDYLRRTKVLSGSDAGPLHIETYFKRYYVLLLARNLKERSDNYILPPFDSQQLGLMESAINELFKVVDEMKNSFVFVPLGFSEKEISQVMDKKLLALLHSLKREVAKQLLHRHQYVRINQKKCDDYKKQMLSSWKDHSSLREIFTNYLQAFENKTVQNLKDKPRGWGIDELINKSVFLEGWDPDKGIGARHGRTMANAENSFLFDAIAEHCKWHSQRNFDAVLRKMIELEQSFILSTRWTLANFLSKQDSFTLSQPSTTERAAKTTKLQSAEELSSFIGYYDYNEHNIPVFVIDYSGSGHQMLILNRIRLGKMLQMPFYSLSGRKHKNLQNKTFYFKMEDLATSSRLVKYYIDQKPPWLKEKGPPKAQREYLRELMLVKILENLAFEKATDFTGYKVTVKEEERTRISDDDTGLLPV